MSDLLEGPTAIAISTDDATAPARVLAENAKKMDALELKGGVVDGTFYDSKMIQVIANIPSREILLGRLFGSMQSPVANFARVIKQIAESKEEVVLVVLSYLSCIAQASCIKYIRHSLLLVCCFSFVTISPNKVFTLYQ